MKYSLSEYLNTLKDKKVLVLGIGVSNRPLVRLLLENGISVTACDRTPRGKLDDEVLQLEKMGAKLKLGEDYLKDLSGDVVFRTPGIHPDTPELQELLKKGAVLTSEMEVFFDVCPCKIISVTGSDGKTTTSTLIAEILRESGKTVWVGGNIGQPLLCKSKEMKKDDIVVVELSSFQLLTMRTSASTVVVTNVSPNHLNVHKDYDEYKNAKANAFLYQNPQDTLIVNADNDVTAAYGAVAPGNVLRFSRKEKFRDGCYVEDGAIYLNGNEFLHLSDIFLPGAHNAENYMAAILATKEYATKDNVLKVARNFKGVEHRIEFVREYHGIKIYNDSVASSPSRTIAGLKCFDKKIILLAGGQDKGVPFDELGKEICERVKVLVLCGATAEQIETAVKNAPNYREGYPTIFVETDFEKAVKQAVGAGEEGDIVALSPACTSFDRFPNFAVRGKVFKEIVMGLN